MDFLLEKMETSDGANQIDVALQHVYKNLIKANENRGGVPYVILLFTFRKSGKNFFIFQLVGFFKIFVFLFLSFVF